MITGEHEKVINQICRYFQHRVPWGVDHRELRQQAYLWALEIIHRHPDRASDPGYLFKGLRGQLGDFISKTICPVSIGSNWTAGRNFRKVSLEHRVEDATYQHPEAEYLNKERKHQQFRWNVSFRRILESVYRRIRADSKMVEVIERRYGLDGLDPIEPKIVAEQYCINIRVVYQCLGRFMSALRNEIKLYPLYQQLSTLE